MKICRCLTALLVVVSAVACATPPLRPLPSQFDDIPVPKGLVYQPAKSLIIESPSAKAARLVYRGRITPDSLGLLIRTTLEANGWRHVNTNTTADRGTVQVYEKAGGALQIDIYEGLWFTYAAFGASQTLATTTRPAVGAATDGAARPTADLADQNVTERGNDTGALSGNLLSAAEERQPPPVTQSNRPEKSVWEKAAAGIKGLATKIFSK